VTPGPGHRKCTPYLWPGPGGAPLALPLTEWLGVDLARRERVLGLVDGCGDVLSAMLFELCYT